MAEMQPTHPRVLLLAPPGRGTFIRDNYCSFSSKADYYWPPIDLVVQSGILQEKAAVTVLDATAEHLDFDRALDRAAAVNPAWTVFVTGTASFKEDMDFVARLKERTGTKLIGSGGNLTFWGDTIMRDHQVLDGILLEFISRSVAGLVDGVDTELESLLLRDSSEAVTRYGIRKKKNFKCGIPLHSAFPQSRYKVPQARKHPFVRTLTSFGCSYQCDFCIESRIPLVYRDQDELFRELHELAAAGIPEIYFMDNVLTAWHDYFLRVCKELETLGCFSWFGQSRADNLNEEVVVAAKRAGCHFMMIGVESGSELLLKAHRKGHGLEETLSAFALLRKHGIESLAYFIVGLPGETIETMRATLELALRLPCDYVSFTIATPDPGTPMRDAAIGSGELDSSATEFDCSRGSPIRLGTLTADQLARFQKTAHRAFYLRPSYLARQIARLRGPADLLSKSRTAYSLLFGSS